MNCFVESNKRSHCHVYIYIYLPPFVFYVFLITDGGMWTLARMVTASIKSGGDGRDAILSLEAGTIRDRAIDGVLRRKKKR
jgi:hypothetical protein